MVEPSARTTVVVHADCRGELCQAGSSALGTGLDAVHRTGAGDQHTVCWDTIVLGILGYWDTGMRDKWIEDLVQGSGRGVFGGLTFGGWRLSGLEGPGVWGAAGLGSGGLESAKSSP